MSRKGPIRSTEAGPDWDRREDDEDARRDPLFRKLVAALKGHKLNDDAILPLHIWLLSARTQVVMDVEFARTVGTKTHREQIAACVDLEGAANTIAWRLDFLTQLLAVDDFLFRAFVSEHYHEHDSAPPSPAHARRAWGDYRTRLHADAVGLAAVAAKALSAMRQHPAKMGARNKTQRDTLFNDLVDRVAQLVRSSDEIEGVKLALKVWNKCFPEPTPALATKDARAASRRSAVAAAMRIPSLAAATKLRGRRLAKVAKK